MATDLPFLQLRKGFRIVKHPSLRRASPSGRDGLRFVFTTGVIMEETAQKSCWGITARAVIGFSGILALAYLFGGI
jgi:hypothetical protein